MCMWPRQRAACCADLGTAQPAPTPAYPGSAVARPRPAFQPGGCYPVTHGRFCPLRACLPFWHPRSAPSTPPPHRCNCRAGTGAMALPAPSFTSLNAWPPLFHPLRSNSRAGTSATAAATPSSTSPTPGCSRSSSTARPPVRGSAWCAPPWRSATSWRTRSVGASSCGTPRRSTPITRQDPPHRARRAAAAAGGQRGQGERPRVASAAEVYSLNGALWGSVRLLARRALCPVHAE
jgi:hypothetical protein